MGGSYGGYMALSSLVHYGDRLAGGIDVVGISNFVTFLTNTSAYRRDLRRAEYGDERDAGDARVPAAHLAADQRARRSASRCWSCRALNDPRVPASESEQMVQQLRAERRARCGISRRRTRATASARRATAMRISRRWRSSCAG